MSKSVQQSKSKASDNLKEQTKPEFYSNKGALKHAKYLN